MEHVVGRKKWWHLQMPQSLSIEMKVFHLSLLLRWKLVFTITKVMVPSAQLWSSAQLKEVSSKCCKIKLYIFIYIKLFLYTVSYYSYAFFNNRCQNSVQKCKVLLILFCREAGKLTCQYYPENKWQSLGIHTSHDRNICVCFNEASSLAWCLYS